MSLYPLGKLSKLQGEVKCKSKDFFVVVLNLKGLFLLLNVIANIANEFLETIVFLQGINHEIKRHLLLGRKVMTNLERIFKSRDITLPTKVRLVKAMVFPVVMYGCESWTVKKAECRRIDAF